MICSGVGLPMIRRKQPVPHRRAPVKKNTSVEFAVKCVASLSLAMLYIYTEDEVVVGRETRETVLWDDD